MGATRKPWLAGLLSILAAPGLGQLYNGRPGKSAFFLFGSPLVVSVLFLVALQGAGVGPIATAFALAIALQVYAVVDAVVDARRLADAPRRWYSQWWALASVYAGLLFVLPVWALALVTSTMQAFKLPTGTMEPTLLIGDHTVADMTAYGVHMPFVGRRLSGPRMPRRGDIVVFPYPEIPDRMFLQRVIGLPGETVEIRDRVVHVDGRPLAEPYVKFLAPPPRPDEPDFPDGLADWGPQTVPPARLLLLGDNRDNSKDSRYWGFLPVGDLRGRIRVIYYSVDERGTGAIRWDRIGREPR